jgi:hypothetical protein
MTQRKTANKTQATDSSVETFLASISNVARQSDARELVRLYERSTGAPPVMWGGAIIGFGRYSYTYASGRSGEMCAVGFSPRKANFTLYFRSGFAEAAHDLNRLGPHTTSVSCLMLKRLSDVNLNILCSMVEETFSALNGAHIGSESSPPLVKPSQLTNDEDRLI